MNRRTPCECEFCWKFHRTPALGGTILTTIEALSDSGIIALETGNQKLIKNRLNRISSITRALINETTLATIPYEKIYRCTYRENNRTRCNIIPATALIENSDIKFRCKKHNKSKDSYEPESNMKVRYPSMCVTEFVYCWHCGQQFKKTDYQPGKIDEFENCPHCHLGFNDLSKEAQKAVLMTLKPLEGLELSSFL